jgi:hypothetical protein
MSWTIRSARFANLDNDAAEIETAEAGAVAISEADTPDAWAGLLAWRDAGNDVAAYAPPPIVRQTPEQKLAALGLTVDDIRALLA